jgi:hypothetical protein
MQNGKNKLKRYVRIQFQHITGRGKISPSGGEGGIWALD